MTVSVDELNGERDLGKSQMHVCLRGQERGGGGEVTRAVSTHTCIHVLCVCVCVTIMSVHI